ncbi:hypothetical protein BJY59DRAFT_315419 [Rhodotorula toruloides]
MDVPAPALAFSSRPASLPLLSPLRLTCPARSAQNLRLSSWLFLDATGSSVPLVERQAARWRNLSPWPLAHLSTIAIPGSDCLFARTPCLNTLLPDFRPPRRLQFVLPLLPLLALSSRLLLTAMLRSLLGTLALLAAQVNAQTCGSGLVLETSYGVSACCLPQTLLQCSSTVLQFTQSGSYLDAQKVCTYKPLAAGTYIQFSAPSFMSYVPAIELFGVPGEAGNVKNSSTAGGLGAQVRLGGTWGAPFSLVVPSVTP